MRLGSRPGGLLAFAVLLAMVFGTAWALQPHEYRRESASRDVFSAERAMLTVEAIASQPHPIGSTEHDRVRDLLVGRLRALGLDAEVQTGIGRYPAAIKQDVLGVGRVDNIVARIPGTNPTGTIYLAAHYDSVPSGPGANDDGVGVATVLETVRALREGTTSLRNDVTVLLTDGEEPGLFGAEAFVAAGGYDQRASVVLNHEARGAGGPPLLWRLTRPDGSLIRSVAEAAPHPNTDSLSTALAGDQTSSNTDFAALEPAGMRVLDWAYTGKNAYYHNKFDDPAHVNPATVQQMGDNTLALTKKLGDQDLAGASTPDPAYFALPFGVLAVLPVWTIIALAMGALGVWVWVLRRVRRAGEATIGRVLGSAALIFAAAVVAVPAGIGVWQAVLGLRPEYRRMFVDPYRPEWYGLALIAAVVTILVAGYLLARRIFGATSAAVGVLGAVTVTAAGFAALAPGSAFLLAVPAFAAAVGVATTFVVPTRWRLAVLTVFLIPAAVLLGTQVWSTVQAGIAGSVFLVGPTVVLVGGLLLLPLTDGWPRRRTALIPVAALVTTAALIATGLAVDRFDAQHPRTVHLVYALDAETGAAQWLSQLTPDEWTRGLVRGGAANSTFASLWPKTVASGPAPAQPLSAPLAEITSDTTISGQRRIHLRLRSTRGATTIALHYNSTITSLRVAGRDLTPAPKAGFRFAAAPPEGIEVELTAPAGPLPLRVIDYSWLPDCDLDAIRNAPDDTFFRQDSTCAVTAACVGCNDRARLRARLPAMVPPAQCAARARPRLPRRRSAAALPDCGKVAVGGAANPRAGSSGGTTDVDCDHRLRPAPPSYRVDLGGGNGRAVDDRRGVADLRSFRADPGRSDRTGSARWRSAGHRLVDSRRRSSVGAVVFPSQSVRVRPQRAAPQTVARVVDDELVHPDRQPVAPRCGDARSCRTCGRQRCDCRWALVGLVDVLGGVVDRIAGRYRELRLASERDGGTSRCDVVLVRGAAVCRGRIFDRAATPDRSLVDPRYRDLSSSSFSEAESKPRAKAGRGPRFSSPRSPGRVPVLPPLDLCGRGVFPDLGDEDQTAVDALPGW